MTTIFCHILNFYNMNEPEQRQPVHKSHFFVQMVVLSTVLLSIKHGFNEVDHRHIWSKAKFLDGKIRMNLFVPFVKF